MENSKQKKSPQKYITIALYSVEKYYKDKAANKLKPTGQITKKLNVTGLSDDEIQQVISEARSKQLAINEEYHNATKTINVTLPEISESTQPLQQSHIVFDEDTGNTFVLFGSSKSGKSTLMMEIYNSWFTNQKMILTTLFAMNPQIPIYNTGNASKYIIKCDKFDKNVSCYIDWQRKLNKVNNNKFHFLNMFDDFIDMRYSKIMNNLLLTYRNSNMSAIVCLQYVKLLSKSARSNVNNIFLLNLNTDEVIEDAIKSFLIGTIKRNNFVDIDKAIDWYRDITSDHNYIHINPLHRFIYFSKTQKIFKL